MGPYAEWFRNIFFATINTSDKENTLKEYLKTENNCLVFEVIDPVNDPHIIEYKDRHLVLLDIVKRDIHFSKLSYAEVDKIAEELGFEHKKLAFIFNDWESYFEWSSDVNQEEWTYDGNFIEGFVLEDSKGFMVKEKLAFYKFWKHMRWVREAIVAQKHKEVLSSLQTPLANEFYGWLMGKSKGYAKNTSLIQLRKDFYAERGSNILTI
jgi:tRNA splicing ligase